jgi:hypothetical protein
MTAFRVVFFPFVVLWVAFWAVVATIIITVTFPAFWLFGGKLTVRESGEVVGYLRWFKFYPKLDK